MIKQFDIRHLGFERYTEFYGGTAAGNASLFMSDSKVTHCFVKGLGIYEATVGGTAKRLTHRA